MTGLKLGSHTIFRSFRWSTNAGVRERSTTNSWAKWMFVTAFVSANPGVVVAASSATAAHEKSTHSHNPYIWFASMHAKEQGIWSGETRMRKTNYIHITLCLAYTRLMYGHNICIFFFTFLNATSAICVCLWFKKNGIEFIFLLVFFCISIYSANKSFLFGV